MFTTLLTLLLISNAFTLKSDKSILFSRVVMVSLIHTSFLAYNNLFFIPLGKGIGIFGGLFHVTVFTQMFDIFIFVLTALILVLTSFYPKKEILNILSSLTYIKVLPIIISFLILISIKIPFNIMLTALGLEKFYFLVIIISSILVYTVLFLLREGEYLNVTKIILIAIFSLLSYTVISFLHQDMAFLAQSVLSISFSQLGLSYLDGGKINLFSENPDHLSSSSKDPDYKTTTSKPHKNVDNSIDPHLHKDERTLLKDTSIVNAAMRSHLRTITKYVDLYIQDAGPNKGAYKRQALTSFDSLSKKYDHYNALNNTLVHNGYLPYRVDQENGHTVYKTAETEISKLN